MQICFNITYYLAPSLISEDSVFLQFIQSKCSAGVLTSEMLLILTALGGAQHGLDPWRLLLVMFLFVL